MSARRGYLEAMVDVRDVILEAIKKSAHDPQLKIVLLKLDEDIQAQKKIRMADYDKELIDDQTLHSNTSEFSV